MKMSSTRLREGSSNLARRSIALIVIHIYIFNLKSYKTLDEKKDKRVLSIELEDDVKKVSITGLGDDNQVVMAQELDEDELDLATGGTCTSKGSCMHDCPFVLLL